MTRLADLDVDAEAEKLVPKAIETAKQLGHAAAIIRRGTEFFVWDSWQEVKTPMKVLRLVSASGAQVRP